MIGNKIPYVDIIESVPYTQGSNVTTLLGNIFRKGNLVYFSFYANCTCNTSQEILTITNAKDLPKSMINFGGAYDGGNYHGGGVFYINTAGKLYQNMAADSNEKRVSIIGVYEAAE